MNAIKTAIQKIGGPTRAACDLRVSSVIRPSAFDHVTKQAGRLFACKAKHPSVQVSRQGIE